MADPTEERKLLGAVMTPEKRADFKAWVSRPEYRQLIADVMKACGVWKAEHPDALPVWMDNGDALVLGDPAVDSALGLIAGNQDAKDCLRYADRQTHHQATVLTMQLALIGLGWVK